MMKITARRVTEFLETYSSLFAEIEIRSLMDFGICAGWLVDLFKYLDFGGFTMSTVVGNWREGERQAVRMIYVNEKNEIMLFRAYVDFDFVGGFFEMLREVVARKDKQSPEWPSGYIKEALLSSSDRVRSIRVKREDYTDMTDFALRVGDLGRLLLMKGEFPAWIEWSRWVVQLVKVLKIKELKTLARAGV